MSSRPANYCLSLRHCNLQRGTAKTNWEFGKHQTHGKTIYSISPSLNTIVCSSHPDQWGSRSTLARCSWMAKCKACSGRDLLQLNTPLGLKNLCGSFRYLHLRSIGESCRNGPTPVSFCLFSVFSHGKYITNTMNDKIIDGVLGTWTWGGKMVVADKSTELWWHPLANLRYYLQL